MHFARLVLTPDTSVADYTRTQDFWQDIFIHIASLLQASFGLLCVKIFLTN
jgi:hypothetical protein